MVAGGRVRPFEFFRSRLLKITDIGELQGLFRELEKDRNALIEHIYSITWHMRGMTREEAWTLCNDERKIILKQIDERVKSIEKTGLPLL